MGWKSTLRNILHNIYQYLQGARVIATFNFLYLGPEPMNLATRRPRFREKFLKERWELGILRTRANNL